MTIDRALYAAAALGAVAIALTLYAWGQPLICTCGYVQFWVGSIWSSGNSQHIADWYTLSHITHGALIVLFARLIAPRATITVPLAVAVTTGIAWEIIEHTDWVLGAFRDTTIYQGYVGDSVLNATADYVWMLGGFFAAWAMRTFFVLAVILVMELGAAFIARDSLTLTTLMVLFNLEAIENWQQEVNPNPRPQ